MNSRKGSFYLSFIAPILGKSQFEALKRSFWRNPDRLLAAKATFVIAALSITFVIYGKPFVAVTLALGALAGALSETDDHPQGRIKALLLKVISFAISSLAVELLRGYPVWLGIGLSASTIGFILLGGIGERYRGVMFGAMLVGIYAMIGSENSPAWYWQPILLPLGALIYGLFSLFLLWVRPWRLLEEQLGRGFIALSKYLDEKAKLFPSDQKSQETLRTRLALLNVQTVVALDRIKEALNSYGDAVKDDAQLKPYLHYFMLLQSLHERAASSHERYELLSGEQSNRELIEGIGEYMRLLSSSTALFADSLLRNVQYQHPVSMQWMINALNDQVVKHGIEENHPLALVVTNLNRSNTSLHTIYNDHQQNISPRLAKETRTLWQRFKEQLSWNHPRTRYAARLSVCFLVGFAISEGFNIAKGEWIILTILFVLQPTYSATRRRLFQRVLGTACGVVVGVLTFKLLTGPGQVMLMLLSAWFFFEWLRRKYSVSVIFITIFVLCAFNLVSNKGIAVMVPRLADTLIGSILAFAAVRLLWPDWQYKRMPKLLTEALVKNTAYFQAIIKEYLQPAETDDLDYRIARRQAHRADNALALAWQDMQTEPDKYRQFRDNAFTITYLNHALLSYLSAFGANREPQNSKNPEVKGIADEILEALQEAGYWLSMEKEVRDYPIEALLDQIRQRLQATSQDIDRQQYILLYNIAEVANQLLQQVRTFQWVILEKAHSGKRWF